MMWETEISAWFLGSNTEQMKAEPLIGRMTAVVYKKSPKTESGLLQIFSLAAVFFLMFFLSWIKQAMAGNSNQAMWIMP
jgi:hypothetical protein